MKQATHTLQVATRGQGLYDITAEARAWAVDQGMTGGLLTLFCRHTSASLIIQENADPNVMRDLETFFKRLVEEDASLYRHTQEGPDDMPAHIRSALTGAHLSIPLIDGTLALGTWQRIYLFEHRRHPHSRRIVLHLTGE